MEGGIEEAYELRVFCGIVLPTELAKLGAVSTKHDGSQIVVIISAPMLNAYRYIYVILVIPWA